MPTSPFLDQVRAVMRLRHMSPRTEESYLSTIKRFILFHHKRHPSDMGAPEIRAYLTYLAVERHVAASTQNVALSALLFLYRDVLKIELPRFDGFERAQRPERLPVVFTRDEAHAVIARLDGVNHLLVSLLYGSGLRLMECMRLRVKDVDFTYQQITVRDGKGEKDRVTMLPQLLIPPLHQQLTRAKRMHEADLADGYGAVE